MTRRSSRMLAAAVGLWLVNPLAGPGGAQPPAREPARLGVDAATNQSVADQAAARLRQHGTLRNYHIEIAFDGSTAELAGHVGDAAQKADAVRLVQSVPGVRAVRDLLTVPGEPVRPANAVAQAPAEPGPFGGKGAAGPPPAGGIPPPPPGAIQEPMPIFHAPPGLANAALNPPPLPPNAWPTVAPYNNYSRVANPTLQPHNAWPYIGPNYPFPKIPLGWRAIQLEHYNGHWWYGKRATGHDWWRIRYW